MSLANFDSSFCFNFFFIIDLSFLICPFFPRNISWSWCNYIALLYQRLAYNVGQSHSHTGLMSVACCSHPLPFTPPADHARLCLSPIIDSKVCLHYSLCLCPFIEVPVSSLDFTLASIIGLVASLSANFDCEELPDSTH